MKALNVMLLCLVFVSLAPLAVAADMGLSGGFDLAELWDKAQADRDLAEQDAVLLLESRKVTVSADGTVATRVHRVVWIATSVGIRGYADLRLPWNSVTSRLDVEILRTWRDGRWWPDPAAISETAVVTTLPHALNRADDYTTMRETMLLHDGVELPCIMETAYTITETGLPGAGGVFVTSQRDPSVLTVFQVTAPVAAGLSFEVLNGAPEPEIVENEETVNLFWGLNNVPPLQTPLSGEPAAHEPAIVWSTWSDWSTLRDSWRAVFDEAAVLDEALTDSLHSWIEPEPSRWSEIQAVVDQVNKNVRSVHYPDRFWRHAPRSAMRTWDTAYGHRLDRAVLAAALLREAGYEITPVFVGEGHDLVGPGVGRLAGMGDLFLDIKGDPAGLYDPDRGVLTGQAPLIGLPVWRTDQFTEPFLGNSQWPNRLEVTIDLEPDPEGPWQGSGQFQGAGVFCPQGAMAGMENGASDYLAGVVGTVIPGADLKRTNPEIFHQHQVIFGFGFEMEKPEPEDSGRTRLVVGTPSHGLMSQVAGVHLYEDVRQAPVSVAGPMEQLVKVRLKSCEAGTVHLPEPVSVVNEAGEFSVTATEKDGWIVLERKLVLAAKFYPAQMWPQLRALLLEDADPANGTLLLD